jgi:hypothetical protein
MRALMEMREPEETASREPATDRWLAVSDPLAVDDDPDWDESDLDPCLHEPDARSIARAPRGPASGSRSQPR